MKTETPEAKLNKVEWGLVFAIVMNIGTILFVAGVVYGDVQDHERRMLVIEQKSDTVTDRLARIETKLDLALTERKHP